MFLLPSIQAGRHSSPLRIVFAKPLYLRGYLYTNNIARITQVSWVCTYFSTRDSVLTFDVRKRNNAVENTRRAYRAVYCPIAVNILIGVLKKMHIAALVLYTGG